MSTQDSAGVDLSLLSEENQQHFRLLELPPELLELLTSDQLSTLQFKSTDKPGGEGAVICTPDKTYNVRQVNTSNSVYVCQTSQPDPDAANAYRPPGLQGIAMSTFTLELDQVNGGSAVPYLKAALPTYSSTGTYQSKDLKTKQQHFDNIPLSERQCEAAWEEMACFETADPAGSFLPTPSAKLQAWRSILERANATWGDLTKALDLRLAIDEDENWPYELSNAVLRSVTFPSIETEYNYAWADERSIRAIGDMLLAASATGKAMDLTSFLRDWRGCLPEKCRSKALLDLLPKDCYALDDAARTITSLSHGDSSSTAAPAAAEAKSALGAKRKWHEKFRASKTA